MASEASNKLFEKHCEDIAHSFVQTMVFVDDDAGYEGPTTTQKEIKPPEKGVVGRAISKSVPIEQEEDEKQKILNKESHPLNVDEIIESAMKSGLICSVFKPQTDEDFKLENLKAMLTADIVCFDWILRPKKPEDNGKTTAELIKGIIQEDLKVGGRHRLIAIYTFKHDFKDILSTIKESLAECSPECELDIDNTSLMGNHFRILCLKKYGGSQAKEHQVTAKDLPRRLIKEFSLFNQGLISSLTMASIAILRDSTAHILAKLNANLDGPFLTHKCLLPIPEDATAYASEIIASELKTAIHKHRKSDELLSDEIIKTFIERQTSLKFKYLKEDGSKAETEIGADLTHQLITNGVLNTDDAIIEAIGLVIEGDDKDESSATRSLIAKALSSIFADDYESALNNNLEFLRVATIATDRTSKIYIEEVNGGSGKNPLLQLGTIVKQKGDYLLCLQPTCDSERVHPKGQNFLFLNLSKVDSEPMLVVRDGGELVQFTYKPNVKNSCLICFEPTDEITKTVIGIRDKGLFYFKNKSVQKGINPLKFDWVAELKLDIARKIGQELSNQYSRIGLDEFELSRMGWKYK